MPVVKVKAVRPDGGIWIGARLAKIANLNPDDKVSITIDNESIVIKKTTEEK